MALRIFFLIVVSSTREVARDCVARLSSILARTSDSTSSQASVPLHATTTPAATPAATPVATPVATPTKPVQPPPRPAVHEPHPGLGDAKKVATTHTPAVTPAPEAPHVHQEKNIPVIPPAAVEETHEVVQEDMGFGAKRIVSEEEEDWDDWDTLDGIFFILE